MHGLPQHFDTKLFVGRKVQFVMFTVNTVQFGFDGDVRINVESVVELRTADGTTTRYEIPVKSSCLMGTIDIEVTGARAEGRGTLVLEFADGQVLRFVEDDSPYYESYRIQISGSEVVV